MNATEQTKQNPISIDSTELHTWFERDRSHVELRSKLTDETIIEWWDESVAEAIEDGFLPSRAFILGRLHNESLLHDAAYKYAKERGMLPNAPKHWVAMSGSHGCLPDDCHVYESHKDAVAGLVETFDLGRTRAARLKKDSYLELTLSPIEEARGDCFGAEYCEIVECDCNNPSEHEDS